MREIAGKVPTYFDPYEKGSLASALLDVVPIQVDQSEKPQAIVERARRFSYEDIAESD
jgi:hypothetical protein